MNGRIPRIVIAAVLGLVAVGGLRPVLRAQTAVQPAFDVASIKLNTSGDWRKSIGPGPGGRFLATNQTLRELLPFAYGLPQMAAGIRIVGGPSWIDTDRFDVVAKADGVVSPEEMGAMLRSLLVDRFKLAAHRETRDLPVYALVMAKGDGSFGPGQRRSEVSESACAARRAAIRRREPVPPQDPGRPPVCGSGRTVPGRITAVGWSMAQLVSALMPLAGRVVVEKTGQAGLFDMDLEWTQLGVKLDAARGPVDVLVVDAVERPAPD